MFNKLLVPLDRSSLAEQAVGQAAAIARTAGAAIDLVSVHQPVVLDSMQDEALNLAEWEGMQRYLDNVASELKSGAAVPTTQAALRGDPITEISRRAHESGADLIVMTSHGRTGLSRAWLGSVADGLVRYSHIPVLLLRPIEGTEGRKAAHHLFKHVLVPIDGSARSAEVLPAAAVVAKCGGGRISLLRVVQPVPLISAESGIAYGYLPSLLDDAATQGLVDLAKQDLVAFAKHASDEYGIGVDAHVVVDAPVGRAILDFAGGHGIDLIAMSTHGRGASRLLIGSVADKVLRGCGLPMLAYRPADVVPESSEQAAIAREPVLTLA